MAGNGDETGLCSLVGKSAAARVASRRISQFGPFFTQISSTMV